MARGDSSGTFAAIIILLFVLVVAAGITAYVFFKNYKEELEKRVAAEATAQKAAADREVAVREAGDLKLLIGTADANAKLDQITEMFKQDADKYGATLPAEQKNYHAIVERQYVSIMEAKKALEVEKQQKEELMAKFDGRETASKTQVVTHQKGQETAQKDLGDRTAKFAEEMKRVAAEKEAQKQTLQARVEEMQKQVAKLEEEKNKLQSELLATVSAKEASGTELEKFRGVPLDVPDGEIRWVDQRNRIAWINLGSADNLPVQQLFSVYASNISEVNSKTVKKGAVEVTRILQDHLAEVRITDYSLSDPLMAGDKIFTPTWHPGRVERFAFGGFIDLNGDAQSDLEVVKNIVLQSGGRVDAYVTPKGETVGEITLDTRYLVIGGLGGEEAVGGVKGIDDATRALMKVAKGTGTRVISLEDFLSMLGWTERNRVWNPQSGDEYKLQQGQPRPAPVSGGNVTEYFKKRRPPEPAAPDSAY